MAISSHFSPFVLDLASTTGGKLFGGLGAMGALAGVTLHDAVAPAALPALAMEVVSRRMAAPHATSLKVALKGKTRKRYIVAPLLHQQSAGPATRESLRKVHDTLAGTDAVVRSEHETGPKVLRLTALEAAVLRERFSGLLVEEDVQYSLARNPLLPEVAPISVPKSAARKLVVEVRGNGNPLGGATVVLLTDVTREVGYEGVTDGSGRLTLSIRKADTRFEKVIVVPRAGFWSRVWKNAKVSSPLALDVLPLRVAGFDWGLETTGAQAGGAYASGIHLGADVKGAIIDSGIAPHPSLNVLGGRNYIEGEDPGRWNDDGVGHGTHCAGVVAAIARQGSVWGYAPSMALYSLRVFDSAGGGGYASDIGDAIEWAVAQGCDLISMSLGSDTPSSYIRSKIEKATDAGVLCVAAAGNEGGPVSYPAKFRNVVGVSAIGKRGTYPGDSLHADAETPIRSQDGQFFLASFSNRGEEVDLCAPGVAVTSTLPVDTYAAWDGTSMACPHVTGIVALTLEATPQIRNAAREAGRMGMLVDRLQALCVDLGFGRTYQGAGLPHLSRLGA